MGRPENVLGMSRINFPGMPLERQKWVFRSGFSKFLFKLMFTEKIERLEERVFADENNMPSNEK